MIKDLADKSQIFTHFHELPKGDIHADREAEKS